MKKILLLIAGICSFSGAFATVTPTVTVNITTGTTVVMSGSVQATVSGGAFINNGAYTDNAGTFNVQNNGMAFSGSGTNTMNNLKFNTSLGTSVFNSVVTVGNTTTITSGAVNANSNLTLGSTSGTLVNGGSLTNNVQGLKTIASVSSGGCPSYTSNLSVNVSGSVMKYQWSSSPDNTTYTPVSGATNATYTATVTSTVYYRCDLTTTNTAYSQSTPGVQLVFTGTYPTITLGTNPTVIQGTTSANLPYSATTGSPNHYNIIWSSAATTAGFTPVTSASLTATPIVLAVPGSAPVAVYSGTLTVTNGCVSTGYTFSVNVISALSFVNGSPQTFSLCENASATDITSLLTINDPSTTATETWSVAAGPSHGILNGFPATAPADGSTVTPTGLTYTPNTSYSGSDIFVIQVSNGTTTATTTVNVTVTPFPTAINGTTPICVNTSVSFSDATGSGNWTSSAPSIASVTSTGLVSGGPGSGGTATISYSTGCGSPATFAVTVLPTPASISGTTTVCQGSTTQLSDTSPGGNWSSTDNTIGSVDNTGLVTGVAGGSITISYNNGCGTAASTAIVVTPIPTSIFGTTPLCVNGSASFSDATPGGNWTSSAPSIASVTSTGFVSAGPGSGGTATISYSTGCGTPATFNVTVNPNPAAITGGTAVCSQATLALTDATSGGAWSSSNSSVASVGTQGWVYGAATSGSATISYTFLGCSATVFITVNPLPPQHNGTGGGAYCSGGTGVNVGLDGSDVGFSYQLYHIGDPVGSPLPGTGSALNFGLQTLAGAYGVVTTNTVTGCTNSNIGGATVTINPLPTITLGTSPSVAQGITTANLPYSATSNSPTTYSIAWSSAAGSQGFTPVSSSSLAATPIVVAVPGAAPIAVYSGTLTVTNSNTCVSGDNPFTVNVVPDNVPPTFNGGSPQSLAVCQNSGANSINSLLVVTDPDLSQTETWSVVTGPSNGTLGGFNATAASGSSTITPTGLTYTPTTGYSGSDMFVIQVSDGTATAVTTINVTVTPIPTGIFGTTPLCVNTSASFSDATSGGNWTSSSPGIASVTSVGYVSAGSGAGIATISYSTGCGAPATFTVTVVAIPSAINGATILCAGSSTTLSDAATGGVWSSDNTGTAIIGSSTGVMTGISSGTATISYNTGCGAPATEIITVNALPSGILGAGAVCAGSTLTLSDPDGAGTWVSSNPSIATVGSGTGIVTALSGGTSVITYIAATGCHTTATVTVSPIYAINGSSGICLGGSTITLTDATAGGTWSSSNTAVATVGATTGVVTGLTAGSTVISYTVPSGCYRTQTVTVGTTSSISGATSLCNSGTATLSDSPSGGVWSSSNGVIATVGSATGLVTASASAAGTATISYSVGACIATQVITVNANPTPIQGAASECAGSTVTLTDNTSGGTWSSTGGASVVTSGSNSGAVTGGASAGTAMVTYTLTNGCYATYLNNILPNPATISGSGYACVGATTMLTDATGGSLSWTSSNTAVATVINSGQVTGVATGTATITYKVTSGCITTTVITVNVLPGAITGSTPVCSGLTITLSDPAGSGTWTSNNTGIASVGSSSGIVTGVAGGTAKITYTADATGCPAIATVTVNTIAAITGTTTIPTGASTNLTDASAGGTWSSSNTGIVTVGTGGTINGVATGTATISYTVPSGCVSTTTVNITAPTLITGNPGTVCQRSTLTLTDATPGGVWSSSNALVASVTALGVVTGSSVYTGTTTISYTIGSYAYTTVVTVNPLPTPIQGAGAECQGATTTLTDATAGGTWSSSNGNASIAGAGTAVNVTGVSTGSSVISYTLSDGCGVAFPLTINLVPGPILGNFNLCTGATTTLSDATGGALSYTSSNTTVATIVNSGQATGVAAGTATITYKITDGCTTTQVVTVNISPVVSPISGPSSISHATPATLSDVTAGGIWSSSNTTKIALSGSTGSPVTATAVATSGSALISYAVTAGGCTTTVTKSITATPAPPPHGSSTTTTLFVGANVTIADEVISGVWNSSDDNIATVDGYGTITGVNPGIATITHTITGDHGVVTNVTTIEVTALPLDVRIIPNPNKGVFTVNGTMGSTQDEVITLEVADVLGQVIYRNRVVAQGGKLNEAITMSNTLANGMYILNIQSGNKYKAFHFVIEK